MNDTSTTEQLSADLPEAAGHGRHRGAVASQESDTNPHGRHRKPADGAVETAA